MAVPAELRRGNGKRGSQGALSAIGMDGKRPSYRVRGKVTEVVKVQCEACGASILRSTAESYDGFCAPCYKRLNERPPTPRESPRESWFSAILAFLIPIALIVLLFLGVPLGFYFVLGGKTSTIQSGTARSVHLVHGIPNIQLNGRPARLISGYLIVELESGRKVWIPVENVAGIEFVDGR